MSNTFVTVFVNLC